MQKFTDLPKIGNRAAVWFMSIVSTLVLPACGVVPNPAGIDASGESDTTVGVESDTGVGDGDGDGDGDGEPAGDGDGDPPDPIVYGDSAPEVYERVDRMGTPGINTVLIIAKDDYNAANPVDDVSSAFFNDMNSSLQQLHLALDDDLADLALVPCGVVACFVQAAPLIVPETLKLDLGANSGFPNGRALIDPVMDVTLAVVLLDLSEPGQSPLTFVGVNPTENDVPFSDAFPYLAPPHT